MIGTCGVLLPPHALQLVHRFAVVQQRAQSRRNSALVKKMIHYGRVQPERGRRHDELLAISGAHAPLTNVAIAWNTMKLQPCADRLASGGLAVDQALLRLVGPVSYRDINFRGRLSFGVERYANTLLDVPATKRAGLSHRLGGSSRAAAIHVRIAQVRRCPGP